MLFEAKSGQSLLKGSGLNIPAKTPRLLQLFGSRNVNSKSPLKILYDPLGRLRSFHVDRSGLSHPCFAHMNVLLSETTFVKESKLYKLSLEVVKVSNLFLDEVKVSKLFLEEVEILKLSL